MATHDKTAHDKTTRCKHVITVTYNGVTRRCRNNAIDGRYCDMHGGAHQLPPSPVDSDYGNDETTADRETDYGETADDRAHLPDGSRVIEGEGYKRRK